MQVTPKDGESEADTDVDSPKEKRAKDGDLVRDEAGGDGNGGGSSDGGNGAPEQRNGKFGQQDGSSSALVHPQSDTKPGVGSFNRGGGFDSHSMSQGNHWMVCRVICWMEFDLCVH